MCARDAPSSTRPRPHENTLPLTAAAARGFLDLVKLLLAARADVNAESRDETNTRKQSPLAAAAEEGHLKVVNLLLEARPDMNQDAHGTALALAIKKGHKDVAQNLLHAGASVNAAAEDGAAPLAAAAEILHCCSERCGCFYKLGVHVLGVMIIKAIYDLGPTLGPLINCFETHMCGSSTMTTNMAPQFST